MHSEYDREGNHIGQWFIYEATLRIKVFKQLFLRLQAMNEKIIETIEKRVRTMTFAEAVQGYEEHEFAIRCSASIVIQSRIDLDHLCAMNIRKLSPSQFEKYSRLKRELIHNLRPAEEDLPCIN